MGCSATRPEAGLLGVPHLWQGIRLQFRRGFRKLGTAKYTEFPVSPDRIKPPASGGFALWDWAFPFPRAGDDARESIRAQVERASKYGSLQGNRHKT